MSYTKHPNFASNGRVTYYPPSQELAAGLTVGTEWPWILPNQRFGNTTAPSAQAQPPFAIATDWATELAAFITALDAAVALVRPVMSTPSGDDATELAELQGYVTTLYQRLYPESELDRICGDLFRHHIYEAGFSLAAADIGTASTDSQAAFLAWVGRDGLARYGNQVLVGF